MALTQAQLIDFVNQIDDSLPIDKEELRVVLEALAVNLVNRESEFQLVDQPRAEAGTDTDIWQWSPERIRQAIEALAGNSLDPAITASGIGTLGGISDGDSFNNVYDFIQALIVKSVPPVFTNPTVSLNIANQTLEVGTVYNQAITATFTQNDGGNLTTLLIDRGGTALENGNTSPITYNENFTLPFGNTVYTASASYEAGPVKNDNLGNPSGNLPPGTITFSRTISTTYPRFYGKSTTPVTGTSVKNLIESLGFYTKNLFVGGNATYQVDYGASSEYLWYAEPVNITEKTRWFISELNQGDIGGASNLFSTPETITLNSPDSLWSGVSYRVYFTNFATSTTSGTNLQFRVS